MLSQVWRPLLKLLFGGHLGTVDVGRLPIDGDLETIANGVTFRRRIHGRHPRSNRGGCDNPRHNDPQNNNTNTSGNHGRSALYFFSRRRFVAAGQYVHSVRKLAAIWNCGIPEQAFTMKLKPVIVED
jgi:hypothetical protein